MLPKALWIRSILANSSIVCAPGGPVIELAFQPSQKDTHQANGKISIKDRAGREKKKNLKMNQRRVEMETERAKMCDLI